MLLELIAKLADTIGLIGVILLLIAYYLLSTSKMTAVSMSYQLLNFFGAAFILVSLFFSWNTASVVIEVAWIIISLIGMYRCMSMRKQERVNNKNIYVMDNFKKNKPIQT